MTLLKRARAGRARIRVGRRRSSFAIETLRTLRRRADAGRAPGAGRARILQLKSRQESAQAAIVIRKALSMRRGTKQTEKARISTYRVERCGASDAKEARRASVRGRQSGIGGRTIVARDRARGRRRRAGRAEKTGRARHGRSRAGGTHGSSWADRRLRCRCLGCTVIAERALVGGRARRANGAIVTGDAHIARIV